MYKITLGLLGAIIFIVFMATLCAFIHNVQGQDTNHKYGLLIFSATWCGPCQQMHRDVWPVLEKDGSLDGLDVYHIDVDQDRKATKDWRVSSMPTIVLFQYRDDGSAAEISRFSAAKSANYVRNWIRQKIPKI